MAIVWRRHVRIVALMQQQLGMQPSLQPGPPSAARQLLLGAAGRASCSLRSSTVVRGMGQRSRSQARPCWPMAAAGCAAPCHTHPLFRRPRIIQQPALAGQQPVRHRHPGHRPHAQPGAADNRVDQPAQDAQDALHHRPQQGARPGRRFPASGGGRGQGPGSCWCRVLAGLAVGLARHQNRRISAVASRERARVSRDAGKVVHEAQLGIGELLCPKHDVFGRQVSGIISRVQRLPVLLPRLIDERAGTLVHPGLTVARHCPCPRAPQPARRPARAAPGCALAAGTVHASAMACRHSRSHQPNRRPARVPTQTGCSSSHSDQLEPAGPPEPLLTSRHSHQPTGPPCMCTGGRAV